MARTSYAEYRRRALKAWRTKRSNAKRADGHAKRGEPSALRPDSSVRPGAILS